MTINTNTAITTITASFEIKQTISILRLLSIDASDYRSQLEWIDPVLDDSIEDDNNSRKGTSCRFNHNYTSPVFSISLSFQHPFGKTSSAYTHVLPYRLKLDKTLKVAF